MTELVKMQAGTLAKLQEAFAAIPCAALGHTPLGAVVPVINALMQAEVIRQPDDPE
jgi:hypothetical protein